MINDFDLKEISEHNISLRKYDYEWIREVCTELLHRRETDKRVISESIWEEGEYICKFSRRKKSIPEPPEST